MGLLNVPRHVANLFGGILTGTRAVTAQSYIEANTKNGLQFTASSTFTGITAGENIDVIFITGDKPVIVKGEYIATQNAGNVIVDIYESPTYTGGADLSFAIHNQTRIAPQDSTVTLIGVAPTDAPNYNFTPNAATKPTVTNVGTKAAATMSVLGASGTGNSSTARSAESGLDLILKPNTTYLYRRHCVGAVSSMFTLATWYEGEPDLPVEE